jgi:hypothetical protein
LRANAKNLATKKFSPGLSMMYGAVGPPFQQLDSGTSRSKTTNDELKEE